MRICAMIFLLLTVVPMAFGQTQLYDPSENVSAGPGSVSVGDWKGIAQENEWGDIILDESGRIMWYARSLVSKDEYTTDSGAIGSVHGILSAHCETEDYVVHISPVIGSGNAIRGIFRFLMADDIDTGIDHIESAGERGRDYAQSMLFRTIGSEMDLPVRLDGNKEQWRGFVIDHNSIAFIPNENLNFQRGDGGRAVWIENKPREWRQGRYTLTAPDINGSIDHEWLNHDTLEMIIPFTGPHDNPVRFKWSLDGAREIIDQICADDAAIN